MSVHEELIGELIDLLKNKGLVDPTGYTYEELYALLSELLVSVCSYIETIQ